MSLWRLSVRKEQRDKKQITPPRISTQFFGLTLVNMSCNFQHTASTNTISNIKQKTAAEVFGDCSRQREENMNAPNLSNSGSHLLHLRRDHILELSQSKGPPQQNKSRTIFDQTSPGYGPFGSDCGSFCNQRPKKIKSQQMQISR